MNEIERLKSIAVNEAIKKALVEQEESGCEYCKPKPYGYGERGK